MDLSACAFFRKPAATTRAHAANPATMFLSRGISRSTVLAAMSGTEHEHFRDRPLPKGPLG
jgi:hypothetical protein